MRRLILIWFLLLITPAFADVCYDIKEDVATKAAEILKNQKEIYKYCSICQDAEPQKMTIQNMTQGNPFLVNGSPIDLAHTYYKENNQFINLGVAAGCIKDAQYDIKSTLESLPVIHRNKKTNKKDAKEQAEKTFKTCLAEADNKKDHLTTVDMIEQNILINDCLDKAIKEQIKQGFEQEQQAEMFTYLEQTRTGLLKFYTNLYSANKYCYGYCGSISRIIPYSDENNLLMQMLEDLIFLNLEKNGY